jgi:hypothetical protein
MISDLYNSFSLLFFRRWPTAEGSITAVDLGYGRGLDIVVVYEFSVGDDGPYTGESASPSWFDGIDIRLIYNKLAVGQIVTVRYRRDCPSVNKLDPSVWKDLEDGL